MLINLLRKNKITRKLIYNRAASRGKEMISWIKPFLDKTETILDVGSGTCNIPEILSNKGYNVTALDVENLSFIDSIKPILYDGKKIPFTNNSFDDVLLLSVLHHTPEPEKILEEAKRVAKKKIIVIEDIYANAVQKYCTYFFDNLFNLEFNTNPHSNRKDREWRRTFEKMGLKTISVKFGRTFLVFNHAIYHLEK